MKVAQVIGLIAAGRQVAAVYDYSELVPMDEYSENYRTLDCWECFWARGKMCHDTDYSSMFKVTGSSNRGHGICCKPNYSGDHCGPSDSEHTCSEPSFVEEPDGKNAAILTNGQLNYQMFAFCPIVSQARCGVSPSSSYDMGLIAGAGVKEVKTTDLRYREGMPEIREYDACYYEVTAESMAKLNKDIKD